MKKVFLKIHLWLSIPLGLIITVICLSGAFLVFQEDINELMHHDRYFAKEVKEAPMPIKELIEKVNSQLTDNTVRSVQIPSDKDRNYVMGLVQGSRASAYVDPYTGKVMDITQRGDGGFFSIMMRLHRWLLDGSRNTGKLIVGYTTLFFVFITITGAIIWWPKTRKQLKNRLQIKTKYGLKRFWLDMHTSAGIYVFIGLLVLSLTGLTYSFRWYSNGFYKLLGVEATQGRGEQGGNSQHSGGSRETMSQAGDRNNRPDTMDVKPESINRDKIQPEKQNNKQERTGRPNREKRPNEEISNDNLGQVSNNNADSSIVSHEGRPKRGDKPHEGRSGRGNFAERGDRPDRGNRPDRDNQSRQDTISEVPVKIDLADNTEKNSRPERRNRVMKDNSSESGGDRQENIAVPNSDTKPKEIDLNQWETVLAQLKNLNPDFKTISIQDGTATVAQKFIFGNVRSSDKYTFDSQSGEITNIQLYKDQNKSAKIRGWVYSLHVGAWGGMFSKIITCIVALIGASLPLTGYYMFIIKRKNKKKKKKLNVSSC